MVPVNEDGWSHDPFGGELVNGEVWGRGAVDMLNLTSAQAVAFRCLADEGFRPAGDLVYFAVADEESGSTHGARWMAENHPEAIRADYVLTESGGIHSGSPEAPSVGVTVGEKGVAWRRLTVRGTPGHGSMPYRTDNALVSAASVVQRIAEYAPAPRVHELWRAQVAAMDLPEEVREQLLDEGSIDGFLAGVFAAAEPPEGTALVAVGGYGRREQCPGSDVDVVLVHRPDADVGEAAQRIWYPLWDAGLKLGHQVGTVAQLLEVATDSLETATSLLAARPVAGDGELADVLAVAALEQWTSRSKHHLDRMNASVAERHARFGEVAFLLEPDLKEARGGLRDVHNLLWVEQATVPILREAESAGLAAASEVLLAVRVELHRLTGQRSDQLLLELQDEVADALGLADSDVLMAEVSSAGRTIAWTGEGAARRTRRAARRRGPLRVLTGSRHREVAPALVLDDGRLELTLEADLADPLLVLRCAVVAARHDAYLQRGSLERLADHSRPLSIPWSAEARDLFVELLACGPAAVPVIEDLDHVGLFVLLVPEWEPCRSRPQRNAYHRFTVDRHLMETAAEASRLVDRVDRPDLLLVGALLHDIGKGYPGDHTEVGVDLMRTIGSRMGFSEADTDLLVAMVEHHLLLPDVATRRDLDDDGTIRSVADALGSIRLLELLGALTEADSIATGPSAWSSWKGDLVYELVDRTRHVLSGGDVGEVLGLSLIHI